MAVLLHLLDTCLLGLYLWLWPGEPVLDKCNQWRWSIVKNWCHFAFSCASSVRLLCRYFDKCNQWRALARSSLTFMYWFQRWLEWSWIFNASLRSTYSLFNLGISTIGSVMSENAESPESAAEEVQVQGSESHKVYLWLWYQYIMMNLAKCITITRKQKQPIEWTILTILANFPLTKTAGLSRRSRRRLIIILKTSQSQPPKPKIIWCHQPYPSPSHQNVANC